MKLSLCLLMFVCTATCADELVTLAERSNFQQTGRYEEVERLCREFAAQWPEFVRCTEFARTPEDRPMLAIVASRSGKLTSAAAREASLPVVLFQGGIHAGEIDGKDAGFMFMRDILAGKVLRGTLDKVVLVFVPVFNVDGHERFGRWNRPNQNGPQEMGWRTTFRNYNLNRDYVKADAPEMRAMVRLLNEWDPLLYIDLHATNGAQYEHDIAILVEPRLVAAEELQAVGRKLQSDVVKELASKGSLPLTFYPSLKVTDDPASGVIDYAYSPRFSLGYWATRNRLGMLVETHSWKDYASRVKATYNTLVASARATARDGAAWQRAMKAADDNAARLSGKSVVLASTMSDESRPIEFRGYAYRREPSTVSGTTMTTYDPSRPEVWRIPLFDKVRPTLEVVAPSGGYIVPRPYAQMVRELLELHAMEYAIIKAPLASQTVEAFQTESVNVEKETSEGRTMVQVTGSWQREQQDVQSGALFVPIAQPKARLVLGLFEPQAPDSFVSWGFLNTHFEAKEYMESYVAEKVAREMLADSQVAEEFARRLEDPKFATDPRARLDFFYRRHSSWDQQLNAYPFVRAISVPQEIQEDGAARNGVRDFPP
jgi:murein tripeptide amidase MpaA